MQRWLWFAPLILISVAVAVWAFRLGWIAATITETQVITTFSARYIAERGSDARLTDCTAQPGAVPSVWILVTCVARDETRYDYPVDRFGRLIQVAPATTANPPQT